MEQSTPIANDAPQWDLPDTATRVDIYRRAMRAMLNDEKSRRVIRTGRLMMPYYPPRGQEMIPAGIFAALRPDDYLCTIYRGTHDMLAKGLPFKSLWAEVAGRATGTCKGKGGPMHITHPESGIMVTTGVVGSSMPIANGLAWASQLKGDGRVTVACFGDGASNIGAFHEALNMASVWKLPVIFVCQNNQYSEHTLYADATSARRIADRGDSYQMAAYRIDGNNPLETYGAAKAAAERARAGEGPTLIEAMTYRFEGHLMGDSQHYMDKDERAAAIAADPVPRFRKALIDEGYATEAELAAIEQQIEEELEEAVAYALASPFPDPSEIRRDVFAWEIA